MHQWPQELIAEKSRFVIQNSEEQALIPQVLKIHEELLAEAGAR
jgi:hypothetical protein